MTSRMPFRRNLATMTGSTAGSLAGVLAPRRDLDARSNAFDLLFAGALTFFLGLIGFAQAGVGGILGLGMLAPLVWRRSRPELVFFAVSAVAVLQWLAGVELQPGNVGLLVALYAISVYGEVRY